MEKSENPSQLERRCLLWRSYTHRPQTTERPFTETCGLECHCATYKRKQSESMDVMCGRMRVVYACLCVDPHVCACIWWLEDNLIFFRMPSTSFDTRSLLGLGFISLVSLGGQWAHRLCFCFSSTEITTVCHHAQHFDLGFGFKLKASCSTNDLSPQLQQGTI